LLVSFDLCYFMLLLFLICNVNMIIEELWCTQRFRSKPTVPIVDMSQESHTHPVVRYVGRFNFIFVSLYCVVPRSFRNSILFCAYFFYLMSNLFLLEISLTSYDWNLYFCSKTENNSVFENKYNLLLTQCFYLFINT
jgi:hypothetical protein